MCVCGQVVCPAETPEGQACGLVKNLSLMTYVSVGGASGMIMEILETEAPPPRRAARPWRCFSDPRPHECSQFGSVSSIAAVTFDRGDGQTGGLTAAMLETEPRPRPHNDPDPHSRPRTRTRARTRAHRRARMRSRQGGNRRRLGPLP